MLYFFAAFPAVLVNSLGSLVDVDGVLGHLSEQHEPSYHGGK